MNKRESLVRVHTHTHTHTSRILKEEKRVEKIYSKIAYIKLENRFLLDKQKILFI